MDCAVSSLVHPTAKLVKNSANGLKPVSSLPPCLLATPGKVEQNMILDFGSNHNPTTLSLSTWGKYSICKVFVTFLTDASVSFGCGGGVVGVWWGNSVKNSSGTNT